MGKKACHQISQSSNKEKHQLRSLITVLKPKVYITESSNFKKLVQELTGKGNSISSSPDFVEINFVEEVGVHLVNNKNVNYDQTDYQYKHKSSSSSSVEAASPVNNHFTLDHHHQSENLFQSSVEISHSTDSSIASPVSSYNTSCSIDQGYDLSDLQLFCVDNTSLHDDSTPHEELEDLFAYQEIHSSLLDIADTSSLYDCFAQIEQEASLYDYEFAGLK